MSDKQHSSTLRAFIISSSLLFTPAVAEPPPSADGRMAEYFKALTLPGMKDGYCCTAADCRPVQARWVDNHWEVFIDELTYGAGSGAPNAWVAVPDNLHVAPNPAPLRPSKAVACWYMRQLRCFDKPVAEG